MTRGSEIALLRVATLAVCAGAALLAGASSIPVIRAMSGWAVILLGVAAAAAAVGRGRPTRILLLAASVWLLTEAGLRGLQAPANGALRIVTPAVLAVALVGVRPPRTTFTVLRVACAFTFAGHGISAFTGDPRFCAYLEAATRLVGYELGAEHATQTLRVIGGIDLLTAAAVLLRCDAALLWMTFWGAATALVRMVHGGLEAWPEAVYRVPHTLGPLVVWLHATRSTSPAPAAEHGTARA